MLRQIEWWVQNGPITKNGVLPVTTLFFWKFCFSLRTFYKELIWCTNYPNIYIPTFCKQRGFIWRCFFPVSIFAHLMVFKFVVGLRPIYKEVPYFANCNIASLPYWWLTGCYFTKINWIHTSYIPKNIKRHQMFCLIF